MKWILLAAVLVGCGHESPPPQPPERKLDVATELAKLGSIAWEQEIPKSPMTYQVQDAWAGKQIAAWVLLSNAVRSDQGGVLDLAVRPTDGFRGRYLSLEVTCTPEQFDSVPKGGRWFALVQVSHVSTHEFISADDDSWLGHTGHGTLVAIRAEP